MQKVLFLALLAFFQPVPSWASDCSNEAFLSPALLHLVRYSGESAHSDPIWQAFKKTDAYKSLGLTEFYYEVSKLGSGEFGGTVFKVNDLSTGEVYSIKVYRSQDALDNDMEAFDVLRETIENYSLNSKIPERKRIGSNALKIQYVEGVNMETLRASPDLSILETANKKYSALIRSFTEALRQMANLKPRFMILFNEARMDDSTIQLRMMDSQRGKKLIDIYLKADNVLFNPITNEFWIIDPF